MKTRLVMERNGMFSYLSETMILNVRYVDMKAADEKFTGDWYQRQTTQDLFWQIVNSSSFDWRRNY